MLRTLVHLCAASNQRKAWCPGARPKAGRQSPCSQSGKDARTMDFRSGTALIEDKQLGGIAIRYFAAIFRLHKSDRKVNGKDCYRSHFGNG